MKIWFIILTKAHILEIYFLGQFQEFIMCLIFESILYYTTISFIKAVLDALRNRTKQMVINFQTIKIDDNLKYDLVPINMAAHFYWVVPKVREKPYWKIFLLRIDAFVMLCIFSVFIIISLVWHLIEEKSMLQSFALQFQLLLESGNLAVGKIQRIPARLLVGTAMVSFLIISTIFKTEVLRSLTITLYEYPINSLNDIIKENLKCYISEDMKILFEEKTLIKNYINKCIIIDEHDSQMKILEEIAIGQNATTISRLLKYKFVIDRMHSKGFDKVAIHIIYPQIKFDILFLYLTKGYPLYKRFAEIVARMNSGGFVQDFRNQIDYRINKQLISNRKMHSNDLTFEHIIVAVYLYGFGLLLGIAAFIVEIAVAKVFK